MQDVQFGEPLNVQEGYAGEEEDEQDMQNPDDVGEYQVHNAKPILLRKQNVCM